MRKHLRKSSLAALLLLGLLILSGLLLLQRPSPWIAERVAVLVTRNLLSDRGYSLELEGITGNPLRKLELRGLRIRYEGDLREPFDLVAADFMRIEFDPLSLMKGNFRSEQLDMRGVVMRAFALGSGEWAYPGFDRTGRGRSGVIVDLEKIRLDDLLILRESSGALDSLRISRADLSLFRAEHGTALDLNYLRAEPSNAPPVELGGRFFLTGDGTLTLADMRVVLPTTRASAKGHVELGAGPELNLDVDANPIQLSELAAIIGEELPAENWIQGQVHLSGRIDSLGLSGRVNGELYGYRVREAEFAGVYDDGVLAFSEVKGTLNDNRVDGRATFVLPVYGRELNVNASSRADRFDLASFFDIELPSALTGEFSLSGGEEALDVVFDLGAGSLGEYSFESGRGSMHVVADTLELLDTEVFDAGLSARVEGRIHPEASRIRLKVAGSSRSSRLARVFSADSTLTGNMEFVAEFDGDLEKPHFHLSGDVDEVVYLETGLATGHIELETDSLAFTPMLMHMEGDGVTRTGLAFDTLYLDATLWPDSVRLDHVSLESERSTLQFAGRIDTRTLPLQAELDRLWLRWLGREWLNDRPVRIELGVSPRVQPVAWLSGDGRLDLDWRGTTADSGRLIGLDLAQLAPWIPDLIGLEGKLSGELVRLPESGYAVDCAFSQLFLGGLPAGRLDLSARWLADSLSVDDVIWRISPEQELRIHGGLKKFPDASLGLAALALVDVDGLVPSLAVAARAFPLERLEGLRPEPLGLGGRLSGDWFVGGGFRVPLIQGIARVDSLSVGRVAIDVLRWTAIQEPGRLRVSHFEAERARSRVEGWVVLPLQLSLIEAPLMDGGGELSGDLHYGGRAEDLAGLSDVFAEVGGLVKGDLRLGGSPDRPEPRGYLQLRGGLLRLAGWEEKLSKLDADMQIEGDTLKLLSMHAHEGRQWARRQDGEVSGDGWFTWHGPFRYFGSFDFVNGSIGTLPFFTGTVDGHLELSTWVEEGVPPHPYLEGDLDVVEGILSYEFKEAEEAAGLVTRAPIVSYHLRVRAPSNLYLENDEANLELSGELELTSTPAGQEVSGELETLRGYYTVFGNKFTLIRGNLDFSSAGEINPKIEIEAETRQREDRIQILISNTFAEPQVTLVSEQGYGQEDVMRILMGLPASGEGEQGVSLAESVVRGRVEAELYNRLEKMVSGELQGLVDFSVENRNLAGDGEVETRWQIGRYLPGGLYASYNQGISFDSDIEVGLEYRLYNRLFLRSEVVNQGGRFGEEGLINEYNFDLRLRYEY